MKCGRTKADQMREMCKVVERYSAGLSDGGKLIVGLIAWPTDLGRQEFSELNGVFLCLATEQDRVG